MNEKAIALLSMQPRMQPLEFRDVSADNANYGAILPQQPPNPNDRQTGRKQILQVLESVIAASRQRDIIMSWRQVSPRQSLGGAAAIICRALLNGDTAVRSTEMKTLLLAGATFALLNAVNLSTAMAQEPKPSGGNTWAGISQRVDTGAANAPATTPHYEYRYGYDKHAAWRGHWVLVR